MTYVSNDPSWWLYISFDIFSSYWNFAAVVVVVYDWVLTLGQEIELIWCGEKLVLTPKCSRYAILEYCILLSAFWDTGSMPSVSLTDAGCAITYYVTSGTTLALTAMLGVITIARLHAMYQGSRTMLMFLVIIFLAVNIACGVMSALGLNGTVLLYGDQLPILISMVWVLNTVWEALAQCLSVWAAVKHFRELRRLGPSTGSTIGDCFTVLIRSHVLYFASSAHVSFLGVSCFQLAIFSPELLNSDSIGAKTLAGACEILSIVQMIVLGPRLILSVREYHAKIVAYSDAETSMNLIVFQEHVHVSNSSTV
ncbi:hypothetical protein EV424DRAFT_1351042 [Suillus variegatus]|nr:hypothetical protein EV424DRAFT_1351042 [Suillus variegatus]